MLAGTLAQLAFAAAYRSTALHGWLRASLAGCIAFAGATIALAFLHLGAVGAFALVLIAIAAGYAMNTRRPSRPLTQISRMARWDIPVRMLLATAMVVLIAELAPLLGPHLAGLLSPCPVFGAVLAIFTHQTRPKRAPPAYWTVSYSVCSPPLPSSSSWR